MSCRQDQFPKNKLKFPHHKTSNRVRGSYFDVVLKENIYIASNNIKKNVHFKKIELENTTLQINKEIFTTYFHEIEDSLARFNIFPKTYQRELTYKSILSKSIKRQERSNLSAFLYKNLLKSSKKYNSLFGHVDKLILIQSFWQKVYLMTSRGIILNLTGRFGDRHFFTGLNYIYHPKPKFKFKAVMILNYLLVKFSSNLVNA